MNKRPRNPLVADTRSPAFQRGDAIGYELGMTYREQRQASPTVRKLGRRMLRDARELASQLGFDGAESAVIVAALLCAMHEADLAPEKT